MNQKWSKQHMGNENGIISYKVEELREDVSSMKQDIKEIKDGVANINAKFIGLPCAVHSEKQAQIEKRLDKLEPTVEESKTYVNRLAGALVVITLIIQLVGPIALGVLFPAKEKEVKEKPTHSQIVNTNKVLTVGQISIKK